MSFLLLWAALALPWQAYNETPKTDPIVAIRWGNDTFAGFCVDRHQILAVTTAGDPGPAATAAEVFFLSRHCTGGDYCAEAPSLQTAAKILRKQPGPLGTTLMLLSVSQVPSSELTPYELAHDSGGDKVHFRLNGMFTTEGKLRPENEADVRIVVADTKGQCTFMIGQPVLQGPEHDMFSGGTVVGSIVACDAEGTLQIVPASKLQEMLSQDN